MKSPIEDGNTAEEEVSIMTDFDYHNTISAARYEKYFETVCKLLKPNVQCHNHRQCELSFKKRERFSSLNPG